MRDREAIYRQQNSGGELTPRQRRRITHKHGRDAHRAEGRRFVRDVLAAAIQAKGNKG